MTPGLFATMRNLMLTVLLCMVSLAPALATDPMSTTLVVNPRSIDSLTVANHYASLRGIPDRCIVTIEGVPSGMTCTVDEMRSRILKPLLAELDSRGLANQIDMVAYSADFPTAIKLDADFAKVPDRHQIFTPVGSLNGLTCLYQWLSNDQVNYVAPRANYYSRVDPQVLLQNPFVGKDREAWDEATASAEEDRFEAAIALLTSLIKKHPKQWPLLFRKAGYQARANQPDSALESILLLLRKGVAFGPMFDDDPSFDSIRDHEIFAKLRAEMPSIVPNRMPPTAFSARVAWGQNGLPLSDAQGPRYLLSTVLAVTRGRGTTLDEAIEGLRRAAQADATGKPSTFYFSNSSDVRATTRMPLMPLAAVALREMGHTVIIDPQRLPQGQLNLMGVMLGSANYEWPLAASRLLPGSLADNLTSTSGVLHQDNGQTSMVELLRGGAAGTSGTVTEPYALPFKFPTPLMYAYYAAGASLAEAFYLSVESPYQLLIMGDPLCRPFGDEHNARFTIEPATDQDDAIDLNLHFAQDFSIAAPKLARFEVYFDGKLSLVTQPAQTLRINRAGLPPGWHLVAVVGVSSHRLEMKTWQTASVLIGSEGDCPVIDAQVKRQSRSEADQAGRDHPGQLLEIRVTAPQADRVAVEHLGRRIIDSTTFDHSFAIPTDIVGAGPVRLTPLALRDSVWVSGKPLIIDVEAAPRTAP